MTASNSITGYDINAGGEISFFGQLDTDDDHDGEKDTGAFVWRNGTLSLVVRSGMTIPGVGTVQRLGGAVESPLGIFSAVLDNERGQVFFWVETTAGDRVLLVGTRRP
ncbi:MAG: hypothetical protein QM820_26905 [Minicystis sp.]